MATAMYAAGLAEKCGSEIVALHVDGAETGDADARRSVEQRVADVLGRAPCHMLSSRGSPAREIVACARREEAGLIVMQTRGRRCWIGLLNDSVTARVLRDAPCPVRVSVEGTPEPAATRRILCALALAPSSGKVLQWASHLAEGSGARLTIVHLSAGFAEAPGAWFYAQLHAARRAWALQEIAGLQQEADTRGEVWLGAGSPVRAVTELAGLMPADLLVIGRSPRLPFPGSLQTRAYAMVCEAPCPVWIC